MTRIRNKKLYHIFEFGQSKWLKPYIEINKQTIIQTEKNSDKDGKRFHKLMNHAL